MLLFYRARGRFPRGPAEADEGAVVELARALGVPAPLSGTLLLPGAADRTAERQRAEIRALLGFREATVADAEEIGAWLRDNAVVRTRDVGDLTAEVEARCRALRIEPPTPDRLARVVRAAVRAYDERRHAEILARLAPDTRAQLDLLVQPGGRGHRRHRRQHQLHRATSSYILALQASCLMAASASGRGGRVPNHHGSRRVLSGAACGASLAPVHPTLPSSVLSAM